MTLDEYFAGQTEPRRLFDDVCRAMALLGRYENTISKSQIAFRRRVGFAWVWMPRKVLRGRGAPLVLSVGLHRRDASPRWKQVSEPHPGRFTHHLELWKPADVDAQVRSWLLEAWGIAE